MKASPDGLLTATVRRPDGQPAVSSHGDLAVCDAAGLLVARAPPRVNLQLAQERAPAVTFLATREHAHAVGID